MKRLLFIVAVVATALCAGKVSACTNFLLTKGASADGSTMITYAADSHTRYGQLRYHHGGAHKAGETVKLYNYGNMKFQNDGFRAFGHSDAHLLGMFHK